MPEAAFLAAIRDEPEDDTHRLVYADWLDDNEQPERAEFIRAQVALTSDSPDTAEDTLAHQNGRQGCLLGQYETCWAGPLLQELTEATFEVGKTVWSPSYTFERGFVTEVDLEASQFLRHADALLAQHPITRLRLMFAAGPAPIGPPHGPVVASLAALPALQRITDLTIRGTLFPDEARFLDEHLATLLTSPHLCRLRRLTLFDTSTSSLPASLAEGGHLDDLTDLVLYSDFEDRGAAPLANSALLARLRHLELRSCCLTEVGIREVAASARLQLSRLRIRGGIDHMDDAGVALLVNSPGLAGLRDLALTQLGFEAGGLQALVGSSIRGPLDALDLSGNYFTSADLAAALTAPLFAGLTSLVLSLCINVDPLRSALASAPFFARLRHLDLQGSHIKPTAARLLFAQPLNALRYLDLGNNPIGSEGVAALARALADAPLRFLSLWRTDIGDAGVRALAESPLLRRLRHLDLAGTYICSPPASRDLNGITDAGVQALVESPHGLRVGSLDLSGNAITDVGLKALVDWPGLQGLRRLGLRGTRVTAEGLDLLLAHPGSRALRALDIGWTAIDMEARYRATQRRGLHVTLS